MLVKKNNSINKIFDDNPMKIKCYLYYFLRMLIIEIPIIFIFSESLSLCCNNEVINTMENGIQNAAAVFSRCPTCISNIVMAICAMTCAKNQSSFLKEYINTESIRPYVEKIDFKINENYTQSVYESCEGIIHPGMGVPIMDITCTPYNSKTCDAKKWYRFLGDPTINQQVPFAINYTYPKNKSELMYNGQSLPCNEAFNESFACSCIDCKASCPAVVEPTKDDDNFYIGEINGYSFIIAVVFGTIGIMFIAINACGCIRLKFPTCCGGCSSVNFWLTLLFKKLGTFCAKNPILILAICSWICVGLIYGIQFLKITTNPVELWAGENSQSRLEKEYFDKHFGPFYRTNQLFIKPKKFNNNFIYHNTSDYGILKFGPAFQQDFLLEVFKLQELIQALGMKDNAGLDKVCYAPVTLPDQIPTVSSCVVQSIYGYFRNNLTKFEEVKSSTNFSINYLNILNICLSSPLSVDCLAPYGGPVEPGISVGGMPKNNADYRLAKAIVLTFLVRNENKPELLKPAEEWELKFVNFLKNYTNSKLDIAYSAERSVQDAIQELSEGETMTVVISYLVMFIYIAIALGKIKKISEFLMESKIMLAIGGIVIVLVSVLCSLGFWGYLGVTTTMLAIEVIPFLVLAVGVDNIFIMVHTYNRLDRTEYKSISDCIGDAVGKIGPSILQTAASEFTCFAIGGISNMPAVKTFAMYAAVAILLDFLFQITAFVAIMSLDQARYEQNRLDLFCCYKNQKYVQKLSADHSLLHHFFHKYYSEFIISKWVRPLVLIIFITWTCFSIIVTPFIEPGLDQQLSMPSDSHVVKYFQYMAEFLSMGPPVYWVIQNGIDYTNRAQQNLVCGGILCNNDSISLKLYTSSQFPNITHLARPASSWLDDYIDWLSVENCCHVNTTDNTFCPRMNVSSLDCETCNIQFTNDTVRPTEETFKKYLSFFLTDLPDANCAKAGRASYADALSYNLNENGSSLIRDTYLMQFSTTSVTSKEFYSTLRETRKISDDINNMLRHNNLTVNVFPYCIYFVFYEQYLNIWDDTLFSLGISLIAIFVVTFLITGFDIVSSSLVLFLVLLILINMGGIMWSLGITLNAISLVNLVVSVGIGVEFVSHIIRSFKNIPGDNIDRSKEALSITGSSVLSGITLTKFAGIFVLAFAKSQIFRIFYFQMYLSIVLIGAAHGLILLPVLLSYFGPPCKV